MPEKPIACKGCPMYDDGQGFVPDDIVPESSVMIVMQNPGANEEEQGRPAIGASGAYMDQHFIPTLGLTRSEVSVGNILKCRWRNPQTGEKGNELPSVTGVWNEDKKKWDKTLGAKIEKLSVEQCMSAHWQVPKPTKHLLTLGDLAAKVLGGVDSVMKWRGFRAPKRYDDRAVYVSLHPSYLLQNPKMAIPAKIDWLRFKMFMDEKLPEPIPSRTIIDGGDLFPPAPKGTSYSTFDLEYDPATLDPYLAGIAYFNEAGKPLGGVQVWTKGVDQVALRSWLLSQFWAFPCAMHNAAADLAVLTKTWNIRASRFIKLHDTIQLHAILHSEWQHGLDFCESLYGKHDKMKHLMDDNVLLYNWGDCLTTGYTFHQLYTNVKKDPHSLRVYENENLPIIPIRVESKLKGLRLDQHFLSRMSDELARRAEAAQQVGEMYGWIPNLGSHPQVTKYITQVMKLKLPKNRSSKQDSADKDVIADLRRRFLDYDPEEEKDGISVDRLLQNIQDGGNPVLEAVACYRASGVLRDHYIKPLLRVGVPKDRSHYDPDEFASMCYPDQHTHTQASGRWSTVEPAIPTLPKKLKPMIIPQDGMCFLSFDFDQQELRADAHISLDEPTLDAFNAGYDIHTLNTCDVFKYPKPPNLCDPHKGSENTAWREVHKWEGKDDRRRTFNKRFVYRIRYRGNPANAGDIPGAKVLGLTKKSLVEASNNYLSAHPALRAYWQRNDQHILQYRTARTPEIQWCGLHGGGRKRFLSGSRTATRAGEVPPICREGTNHPFQGLGADVLYLSVQGIYRMSRDLNVYWGCGAHDSQKWIVSEHQAEIFQERVREIMETRWRVGGRDLYLPITLDSLTYAPKEL